MKTGKIIRNRVIFLKNQCLTGQINGFCTRNSLNMDYEKLEKQVRERIKHLQNEKGFTENGLAGGDIPTQKRLNRQLSHDAAITLDTLLRILDKYPDVSADWLLRGSGDMYVTANTNVTGANTVTGSNATVIGQHTGILTESFVRDLLAEKDKQIQTLLAIIGK